MEKFGEIEYDFETDQNRVTINRQIYRKGTEISVTIPSRMDMTKIVVTNPFDRTKKTLEFDPDIENICNDIFPALVHIQKKDEYASAAMASYLFEQFTPYWRVQLLAEGKDVLGIRVWEKVLDITSKWEEMNQVKIHKGTPYFFLAENYLLLGDRDLAFTFLLNGFQEDSVLGSKTRVNNYPWQSPGYFVATMNQGSQMDPLVLRLRDFLNMFITAFQTEFTSTFSIQDFDQKFLKDRSFTDIAIFFHYNFFYVYDLNISTGGKPLQDNFSKLRGLDVFLNLTLIIDEVLKQLYKKNNGNLKNNHMISHSILWLCEQNKWMKDTDLMDYWGTKNLNLNGSDPDIVIPKLLNKSDTYKGNNIPREVFTLLIAYKFRNYGAHNIQQLSIRDRLYGLCSSL